MKRPYSLPGKTRFNNSAVIPPVEIPEENILLTKEGNCSNISGTKVTPKPKPKDTAKIREFLLVRLTQARIFIPATATVANIIIVAPPNTG